ncbi:MAG: hypothetical protein WCF67_01320, partial [Chitinophagaceae bacterium]
MIKYLPFLCTMFLLSACGGTTTSSGSSQDSTTNNVAEKKPVQNAEVMKFVKHEVMDNEGTHMVASTYLIPEGWTAQDRLYWEYNDATVPIRYKGTFKSSDGSMAIQSYPDVRATWNTGPSGTSGYPAPRDVITGLQELIKVERKGINYTVTDSKVVSNT